LSLSNRNAAARKELDQQREWLSVLRYIRLWTEPKSDHISAPVEKFKSIKLSAVGPVLVVTGISPYTYSISENNNEIQYPYMIGVLSFSSRNELTQCVNQTVDTFRSQTSILDVRVESQISVHDGGETRCIMIAYGLPFRTN